MKPDKTSRNQIAVLFFISSVFIVFHYLTPTTNHFSVLHDIYRRILYIPVLLAAFWFGLRGGLCCAIAISAAYLPHIYHNWGGQLLNVNLNRTLETMMYVLIGGITGYLVDTLRKEQHQLAAALGDLREKTRQVFETEEQLRRADKMAALGQLTTTLAHEIRNPLASIQGAVEILEDADTTEHQKAEFRSVLHEEVDHLDHVLKNFLEYARERRNTVKKVASVGEVIQRLGVLFRKKLHSSGTKLQVDIPSDMPPLAIEENLLEQVLFNLIINAAQEMPDGGTITIEVSLDSETNSARLVISDTGPGIALDLQDQIFSPFFTTKDTGTGLGLSIVQKIILSGKGSIRIDNENPVGARFIIHFPIATAPTV